MDLSSEVVANDIVMDLGSLLVSTDSTPGSSSGVNLYNANTKRLDISSLPPEILFSILPRAIPPYALLNTTLASGEDSAWCRTVRLMLSIVLVCRSWYDVGIAFLYENICIRRCQQLEFLQETLWRSPRLSPLVKSLTIRCYIPTGSITIFRANLTYVTGCCTSLSTFVYNAEFVPPLPSLTIHYPTHITQFLLEGHFDYAELFPIMTNLKDTLISFHLTDWDPSFETSENGQKLGSQSLSFPSLQSLSVTVQRSEKLTVLNTLRERWVMPSLQRLTVAICVIFHLGNELCDPVLQFTIRSFLAILGGQLRQLHIGVSGFRFIPEVFKQLLGDCPLLERIILHPSTFQNQHWTHSDDFFHPNLRWIDFRHYLRDKDVYHTSGLCLSKKNLPALECVRRFCNLPYELHRWIDDCPPGVGADMEDFVINVFQHQLDCHMGLFTWRFERDAVEDFRGGVLSGSFTVWEDVDSDSDYVSTISNKSIGSSEEEVDREWISDDEDLRDL